ncbi:hypothetical protein [Lichenifustis flavocetrariae]|uniref:Uncharacterized protein n=1 Tax=Lichenifustis flavocetrariae TaxID=2949735 RepID=A0AA42CLZ1_9HYPH|nr:hypothetical protein [Lichenifustis flavocetrariae]MCW6510966.1 hypothetical protein [Lichenifustis flavocetrariae]
MTKPTGRAPGRPKGAINRASKEQRERAAASGMLPHEFLLSVTRGEAIGGYVPSFAERLEAAKAAAPFYAPKLSAVESTFVSKPIEQMTDDELTALIEMHAAEDLARIRPGKLQ